MTSVFGNTSVFTDYKAKLRFRDKLMGGIPKNPEIIEGWLRAKAGVEQEEEVRRMMLRTLLEVGAEVSPDMSYEELEKASQAVAAIKSTNGLKQDSNGLYIESRNVKAMLKEVTNILYAGDRWGKTKKGPRSFLAERVFVDPDHISLGVKEPSGVEMLIVHVNGPSGPRSSLAYHEYVEQATVEFTVRVLKDEVEAENWPAIWLLAQENGLGAVRSQGFGKFDVIEWKKVSG